MSLWAPRGRPLELLWRSFGIRGVRFDSLPRSQIEVPQKSQFLLFFLYIFYFFLKFKRFLKSSVSLTREPHFGGSVFARGSFLGAWEAPRRLLGALLQRHGLPRGSQRQFLGLIFIDIYSVFCRSRFLRPSFTFYCFTCVYFL